MNTCIIGLGLGGTYTSGGMVELQGIIKQTFPSLNVLRYSGERLSGVIQMLREQVPASDRLIVGGYSWGADNTSIIAAKVGRTVDYLFALQPSVYYPTTPLGTNVREALCVYNPWWFETFGLGFERLKLAEGNQSTHLKLIKTSDSHPSVQYDQTYRAMILAGIKQALA